MTKRDEAIEKAARELRALAKGEPRGFTSTVQRLDAIDKAEAALDAALSLPADPPAPVEERERALVREAWCRGAVVAGQMSPEGTSRPDDVQLREWLASDDYGWLLARHPGMTPSDAIAAVDRSHPRAPTSDAAAYERAAQVCDAYEAERSTLHAKKHSAYQADFSDQDKAIGAEHCATRIRALATQPTPPASDAAGRAELLDGGHDLRGAPAAAYAAGRAQGWRYARAQAFPALSETPSASDAYARGRREVTAEIVVRLREIEREEDELRRDAAGVPVTAVHAYASALVQQIADELSGKGGA